MARVIRSGFCVEIPSIFSATWVHSKLKPTPLRRLPAREDRSGRYDYEKHAALPEHFEQRCDLMRIV